MNRFSSLTLSADLHARLHRHLLPGDGLEAAALLLCARAPGPRTRLLASDAILVPHHACSRRETGFLTWPGLAIEEAIDRAEADDLAVMLLHSHPKGFFGFSGADDDSDRITMPALFAALGPLHGTAIMVPDGAILARTYTPDSSAELVDMVSVAGVDIKYWWSDGGAQPRPVAFTSAMTQEAGRLSVCVIGVSGTGSVVAEQLARLGFRQVILIDFDRLEARNLNRILNATRAGATAQQLKVEAFAEAIIAYRGPGVAVPVTASISTREAVLAASQADLLFSCVDTLEARYFADLIAAAFLQPLFDVGVSIPTRRAGGDIAIADVCGRVDYVYPGGASLRDRGVYDPVALRAEYLRCAAPDAHLEEVQAGYLKGINEQAPAVISLNMRAASTAVLEFIARAYAYRLDGNAGFARTQFSLAAGEEEHLSDDAFPRFNHAVLGRGLKEPLLGLPALRLPSGPTGAP